MARATRESIYDQKVKCQGHKIRHVMW